MNKIKNIIFDLGGVLIDWSPDYVYLKEFNGNIEKMNWFYENICTMDWNENQDAGYSMKKATVLVVKVAGLVAVQAADLMANKELAAGAKLDATIGGRSAERILNSTVRLVAKEKEVTVSAAL